MTFSKCLKLGEIGEHLIHKQFKIYMVSFEEDPNSQRSGIDGIRGCLTHEVKTRHPDTTKYWSNGPDIAIETVSVREENVIGWIYTSIADVLFYGILNQQLTDWWYLWRIRLPKLQAWWKRIDFTVYPIKIAYTRDSHSTENRIVPFSDIPKHIWKPLHGGKSSE